MKLVFSCVCLFLPAVVFAQLDTFVTSDIKSFGANNSSKKDVHYIFLDPEKKTKLMEGNFIENKKDGLWFYYKTDYNKIAQKQESFKNGVRDGVWIERYANSEQIERKEEYAAGIFTSGHCYSATGEEMTFFKKVYKYCESMPIANYDMKHYLWKNVKYPSISKRNGVEGQVMVTFVVTEDGSIIDPYIQKGLDSACNAEALRVIKNLPPWIPGRQDNMPVPVSTGWFVSFK